MLLRHARLDIQFVAALLTGQGTYVKAMHTDKRGFRATAALMVLLVVVQGCSKIEHAVGKRQPSQPESKTPTDPSELALANMVSAVSSTKPNEDLQLKFQLHSRPIVGQPLDIDVALVPGKDLDRVYATFQGSDGVEVTAGGRTEEIEHPPVGTPLTYTVTVLPRRDGVLAVNAVVLMDSSDESVTRTFAIPVIAGAGASPAMAAAPPAGAGVPGQ